MDKFSTKQITHQASDHSVDIFTYFFNNEDEKMAAFAPGIPKRIAETPGESPGMNGALIKTDHRSQSDRFLIIHGSGMEIKTHQSKK